MLFLVIRIWYIAVWHSVTNSLQTCNVGREEDDERETRKDKAAGGGGGFIIFYKKINNI